jgi:MinD-like ATPase involved in chromosome partitioning or flagellar assembly
VLVTVQGPEQRVELQLPADRPIVQLLPLLVEVCGGGQRKDAKWELAPLGGLAYDGGRTLHEVGVMDGSLLHLRDAAAIPSLESQPEPELPYLAPTPAWDPDQPPAPYPAQPPYEPAPATYGAQPVAYSTVPAPYYPQPFPEVAEPVLPQDRTRLVLPVRLHVVARVVSAATAAARAGEVVTALPAPQPQPGQIVNPSSLMVRTSPRLVDRIRRSWRSTDYLNRLDDVIVAPQLRRCATIAVMSPKGGVGKTTTTTLLGCLFALLRRDRIVAIDTNPDFGSLGRQLAPEHTVFVDDLYEVLDEPELTATALDNHLGRAAHGLMVLPAPTDPVRISRLDADAYARVVRKLQQMVGVIVLDTGTGLHEPAARAALATADQVVLVSDSEPSTASLVAEAAALLKEDGLPIWLLMNKSGVPTDLDLRAFGSVIPHARGLIEVGSETAAARRVAGGRFTWIDAPGNWRRSVRELAAALVVDWPELGIAV